MSADKQSIKRRLLRRIETRFVTGKHVKQSIEAVLNYPGSRFLRVSPNIPKSSLHKESEDHGLLRDWNSVGHVISQSK